WREQEGDILAFLPGVREIERVKERLDARMPQTPILPLHGQIDPAGQRAAIGLDRDGRRRIVLATSIAETSLTLDGVSIVVDSGLARMAEFDRAAGTTQLVTRRASQAAAAQRAGRAARQGPGVAYRLWEEAGHPGRPEFAAPEIETADLSGLVLRLARWGTNDPASLAWLDAPPAASIAAARDGLKAMGALDAGGHITTMGEAIVDMPMAPHEAAALLYAADGGCAEKVAGLVMLLQERGLGGRSEDLAQRMDRWRGETSRRAQSARRIAQGWADRARKMGIALGARAQQPAEALALARPDFVARRRDASGENWISAGGRGFTLDPTSPLARAEWLVIGEAQGSARSARITSGLALHIDQVERLFETELESRSVIHWNTEKERVEARRERRLGAIKLSSAPDPDPDPQAVVDKLAQKALERLGELLPP
ncbi:MAG: helicase-related protein, partial [Pseudomonadota bacterium]